MLEIICLAIIGLFFFLLVSRIMKKRGAKKVGVRVETPIEIWARSEATKMISERLEVEEADVAATIGGNPDPDMVTRLEKAVQKVEVVYERVPGAGGSSDVRVEITFEDGRTERSVRRIDFAELPAEVKDEFAASGTAHVFRPWLFPWQR
jgi:hypothetical protein